MAKNKPYAFYCCPTTKQDWQRQREAAMTWCEKNGREFKSLVKYQDGYNDDRRTAFKVLLKDCRKGLFGGVLVYNLNLISTRIYESIRLIQGFDQLKIDLVLLTQPCFTMNRGTKMHERVHDILHELAENQRVEVSRRTRAGIADYKRKNRGQWGRKRIEITAAQGKKIRLMREQNVSYKTIAKEIGVSVPKVFYYYNPRKQA